MFQPLKTITQVAMYQKECFELYRLDTGVKTIDAFVRKVEHLSFNYIEDHGIEDEEDEIYKDKANSFKGDMLEVLAEIFFGAFINDPVVGLKDYMPVPLVEDYGVDALATNVITNKVAVQCKFRSNPSDAITYGDIAKTASAAIFRHHLTLDADDVIFVFTTCNSVNKHCKAVFGSKIRLIGRSIISARIDNNDSFWKEAEQRIVDTFNVLHPVQTAT